MEETMLTYINEEYRTNKSIIKRREKNMKEFLNLIKDKNYERWVILATGSSANAIECAKYYVEDILNINIDIKMPSVFNNYTKKIDKNILYLAVTQGGHSFSTLKALRKVNEAKCDVVTLTANLDSPVCNESKCIVNIGCGEEKVGYVTKGFSSTIVTFMIMGLEVAYKTNKITKEEYNTKLDKINRVIDEIEKVILKSLKWYESNKDELVNAEKFILIGYGPGYGVVKEADTKITETIRIPVNGHELEEYMHGPYLSLSDKDYIIFIETNSKLENRQTKLRNYVSRYTKHTYKITYKNFSEVKKDLLLNIDIDELISPILFVIPIQILSYLLAEDKGNKLNIKIFSDFDVELKSKI